jgi:hypothetical protein
MLNDDLCSIFKQFEKKKEKKSTSYFPYIMYNTKKIRTYRDVQYGKKCGFRLYNTGKIMYGHMS